LIFTPHLKIVLTVNATEGGRDLDTTDKNALVNTQHKALYATSDLEVHILGGGVS